MAYALSQKRSQSGTSSSTYSLAFSGNVTSGSTILVFVVHQLNNGVTGCTDSQGNTYTLRQTQSANNPYQWVYEAIASSTGALTVNVAMTSGWNAGMQIREYSGLAASAYDSTGSQVYGNQASSVTPTNNSGTLAQSGELVIGFIALSTSNGTLTQGSGFVNYEYVNVAGSYSFAVEDIEATTTAAQAVSFGYSFSWPYNMIVTAYKESGGSTPPPVASNPAFLLNFI